MNMMMINMEVSIKNTFDPYKSYANVEEEMVRP